jgi:glycosyltransferase involved in cell wall biosynthesis
MPTKIVVSVISDLVTDQRVHKVCQCLQEEGYIVKLIGAKKKLSLDLNKRDYSTRRIHMLFQRKIFFYAEFNLRLFFLLLFTRADIYLGNDLDTMPANWLAATLRHKPLVYDTHEYYTAMAGLDGKHIRKKIWKGIETFIFPRLKYIYTICDSFCDLYARDYHKKLVAVRNVPYLHPKNPGISREKICEIKSLIPENRKILIFQGAGINQHRGGEELVLAMKWLDPEKFHLLIIGGGDLFQQITDMIVHHNLQDRITIIPKVPFEVLREITPLGDLGLSLDKGDNLNHRFGLPNKIFDYIHAGLPILTSRLVEPEKIVNEYQVGTFIESHEPSHIAGCIHQLFSDPKQLDTWKTNTEKAKQELNWEKESKIVLSIFKQVESERVKL